MKEKTKNTDLIEDITEADLQDEILDEEELTAEEEDLLDEEADKKGRDKKKEDEDDEEMNEESDEEEDDEDMEDDDDESEEDDDEVKTEKKKSPKKESTELPKSKAGLIGAVYQHLNKMTRTEDVAEVFKRIMDISEEIEEKRDPIIEQSKEELDALMEAQESMDDEFKAKAAEIFESAVQKKVDEELTALSKETIDRLEESFETRVQEEVDQAALELIEKVDSYLNYVTEQWIEKNEVAVEAGLRTDIAENFINGLQTLFAESYITVPEGREDIVETLEKEVTSLSDNLNEQTEANIKLSEEIAQMKRARVLADLSEDLTVTETSRLESLVEDVAFDDEDSFRVKVETIKKSCFNNSQKVSSNSDTDLTEDYDADDIDDLDPEISRIAKSLSKSAK